MLKKNTAGQFIYFALLQASDGSAHTGQTPTGYVSIDAAGQAAIGGSIAELANGQYKMVLSQGDTNGDELGYFIVNASSIPVSITVTTETKKMVDLNDIAAGALMGLANDAITSAKYDQASAFPVGAADTGATQIARTGADGDTLESVSDQIDAVPDAAAINAEVDTALSDAHLDHLLLTAYAGEGTVGSILKDVLEDDAGTYRFTANALEQGPDAGDATEAKQDEILVDLVDIKGTAFAKDTNSLVNCALVGADSDTLETLSDQIDAIPDAAAINAQVDAAIETYHLDHLLAVAYDPAAKPGAADALLNELVEDDGGVSRYTANALEQAAVSGGDATAANQALILEDIVDMKGTGFAKDTDSLVDLAHIGADADTLEDLSDEIAAVAASLATTDGKVDDILTDTGTTLDGKLDDILTDTGTTLDGKVTTIDGIVDTIKDILEGDHKVDTATTPWQYLIRKNTDADWASPLVQQDLKTEAGANVTATSDIIGQKIAP